MSLFFTNSWPWRKNHTPKQVKKHVSILVSIKHGLRYSLGMSPHNKRHYGLIFWICGQKWLWLAYLWPNLGHEDYQKCQNRSKLILLYQFPSYMTLESHLGCINTIKKAPKIDFRNLGGQNWLFLDSFWQIFGPDWYIAPQIRSKSMLVCQFQSYMALDSHYGCLSTM